VILVSVVESAAVAAAETSSGRDWPDVVLILGLIFMAFLVFVAVWSGLHENRKLRIEAGQEDALRQLVDRYEQLAEKSMDAQQRVAADVSELRTRTASIEQILRSVE
jgi:hypothetical protein